LAIADYIPATCTQDASLYFFYGDGSPAMGGIVIVGSALGHDFNRLSDDAVCLGCTRCPLATFYQELETEELAATFLELVLEDGRANWEGITYYEIALAFFQETHGWFLD